jgi:hypothetical protein
MDSEAKWGQVVGNIVSEWTQIFGLVLLTKRLIEPHSKGERPVNQPPGALAPRVNRPLGLPNVP